jgi:hypothetical protein
MLAGLVGVGLLVVLTAPDSHHDREQLIAEDPAPPPSATQPPSTAPTNEPAASATAASASSSSTSPAPRATPEAAPAVVKVDDSDLLTDEYVAQAFAQGRATEFVWRFGGVPSSQEAFLVPLTCYWDDAPATLHHPRVVVARAYSWPNELVATTLLSLESSETNAEERFRYCSDPGSARFDAGPRPTLTPLDVGDEGFLLARRDELGSQTYAGARVGSSLVLVDVRRSGGIGSTAPVVAALRGALRKATGQAQGAPVALPAEDVPDPLRGYLSRTQLPAPYDPGRGLHWLWDVRREVSAITCGSSQMAVEERPVTRHWGSRSGVENEFIDLDIATLTGESEPSAEMTRCRQAWEATGERTSDFTEVGDDGFTVSQHQDFPGYSVGWSMVVFRSGGTVVVLDGGDIDAMGQIGQAVLDSYRLSNPSP